MGIDHTDHTDHKYHLAEVRRVSHREKETVLRAAVVSPSARSRVSTPFIKGSEVSKMTELETRESELAKFDEYRRAAGMLNRIPSYAREKRRQAPGAEAKTPVTSARLVQKVARV